MQQAINKSWHFTQPPADVWEFLTRPELLELWLMKSDFRPIVGHHFKFTFIESDKTQYAGIVDCEVLEVIPFSKLSYSWNGKTKDRSRTFTSIVVWTLIPKGDGTALLLSHDGFTVLEDMLTHSSGWDNCLKKMEEALDKTTK